MSELYLDTVVCFIFGAGHMGDVVLLSGEFISRDEISTEMANSETIMKMSEIEQRLAEVGLQATCEMKYGLCFAFEGNI